MWFKSAFAKLGPPLHMQGIIAMVRFWKHKRNPIKSERSSWMLLGFSGSELSKFAPDLWHGLIAARSLEFPALPNFQPPLKQHMKHLSTITASMDSTHLILQVFSYRKTNEFFVIATIMVYPPSVSCLNDPKWVQWRIGVARFVAPARQ